jgi:sister-chromatid-cohesion protein PDS5
MSLILIVQQQAAQHLTQIEQSPRHQVLEAILLPSFKALAREDLLNHEDKDVKCLLAYCLCEVMRITLPDDVPYNDDTLRVILVTEGTLSAEFIMLVQHLRTLFFSLCFFWLFQVIHYLIVSAFSGLSDVNSQSFGKRFDMLRTYASCRLFLMMLDIECNHLITDMFRTFLQVLRYFYCAS